MKIYINDFKYDRSQGRLSKKKFYFSFHFNLSQPDIPIHLYVVYASSLKPERLTSQNKKCQNFPQNSENEYETVGEFVATIAQILKKSITVKNMFLDI